MCMGLISLMEFAIPQIISTSFLVCAWTSSVNTPKLSLLATHVNPASGLLSSPSQTRDPGIMHNEQDPGKVKVLQAGCDAIIQQPDVWKYVSFLPAADHDGSE